MNADPFTFQGRVLRVTEGGAWLIDDGTVRRPVPATWVTLDPPPLQLGKLVNITMARRLAVEKGFLAAGGEGQGDLL